MNLKIFRRLKWFASLRVLVTILCAITICTLWASLAYLAMTDRARTIARANERLTTLTRSYSSYAMALADMSLTHKPVYRRLTRARDQGELDAFRKSLRLTARMHLRLFTADGQLLAGDPLEGGQKTFQPPEKGNDVLSAVFYEPSTRTIAEADYNEYDALVMLWTQYLSRVAILAIASFVIMLLSFVAFGASKKRDTADRRWRALFDASLDGTFIARVPRTGPAVCTIIETSRAGFAFLEKWGGGHIGGTVSGCFPGWAGTRLEAEISRSLKTGTPETFPVVSPGRDESYFISVIPISDTLGRTPTQVIVRVRDVSEIERGNVKLENAIARAEKASAAAEEASRVKSEFLANMSHEIRTPLTSIIGFADLLHEHEPLDDKAKGFVIRVRNGGRALLALINDILDYSKLESGQIILSPEPTHVAQLGGEVFELLNIQAAAKGLQLELACSDWGKSAVALVDAQRLRQIFTNLIGNAIKFTDKGSVRLQIAYTGEENPGAPNRLCCRVVDTGEGMAPDQLQRLFERFSQLDSSLGKRHGGTGLGLAICKGLVEAMQGRIGVTSEPGKGSTFWFEIPAQLAEAKVAADAGPKASRDIAGRSALVVDDNEANRIFVRVALEELGVHVVLAENGERAVALAADFQFDIILMDIRMPGMGGIAAMLAIRGGKGGGCPILAFTAEGERGNLDALIGEGFDGVLVKPLKLSHLQAAVTKVIGDGVSSGREGRRDVA